ncbi:hypothetical protein [Oceanobacillus halophilus]|uniref:IS4 family transposase n=1 Tax=Oceanobacillus halophilus TaxID=930130 RepID=A0A494ZT71_9BACI|nr:hypothetical protein [Oceanobacillus halophilus]RKQ29335.1 hypothetical protein D8M06_17720 [Oceanobacillus halophilus]
MQLDKEFQILFKELQSNFTRKQIEEWAQETGFMKRKTKLKPEYFFLLCSCLGESFGKKSLVELCAQLCSTFDVELTSEGLNQRFNSKAVEFLKKMFQCIFANQFSFPIVENRLFNRIRILDSSGFNLPVDYLDYEGASGSGVKYSSNMSYIRGISYIYSYKKGKKVVVSTREVGD